MATKITLDAILVFCLFLGSCAHINAQTESPQTRLQKPRPNWYLLWSDEFDQLGGPVDPNKWSHEIGGHGWGNNEDQFYTNRVENSRIENGNLIIEARKENFENKKYTSARLLSKNKWRYGRFEMKAKLPPGRGSWPAFWMLSESFFDHSRTWPDCGEIDILEHVGFDPGVIVSSIHSKTYNWMNKNQKTGRVTIEEPFTQYHIYALEWYPDRVQFFVDNQSILDFKKEENADTGKWPFDQETRIIINTAIGGIWGGEKGIDDSSFPQKLSIDYVRVYQIGPPAKETTPLAVVKK